ncbi:MAG: hypothetical protein A2918_02140 [Candidatus Yanofskybacteria bacterium RIFCSPLOWO2_01_FULL_42_49]|uniref:tRNA dimethylallyltransferase n=1 Tax=Candidatus Yanofskybacteria bacterium RIFCSPLOWO2_01_FULL_42_49 TaxID=1802694 RepID=A0A1F8GDK0_9BACT|nr:MAG: hypothetical protein A2918_02140 [Candidatus Yanofskybacteria bacterium RIFCSPLOWO2_01_FULL_42_49]
MAAKINPPAGGQKLIVIVGPTASGKSDLGIKIAKKISARGGPASGWNGAEIISADSRQVYRGMDVGTGKVLRDKTFPVPSSKVKSEKLKVLRNYFYSSGIRHHLIDVASPKKQFTADDFKRLGQKAIKEILEKNKIPIIVGGTGFYIDILLGRMSVAEVPPNPKLRKCFERLNTEHLFKMLRKLDLQRAKTIGPKNKRRLIRALEIILITGRPIPKPVLSIKYKVLWLGLNPKNLKERIKVRLDERLKQGMIEEVINLRKQGVSWKRLDGFGLEYRYISKYLREFSISNFQFSKKDYYNNFKKSFYYGKLLRDIIKYSKRQMTWFKRNEETCWIKNYLEAEKLTKNFVS